MSEIIDVFKRILFQLLLYVTHLYITSLMSEKKNMEPMVPLDSTEPEVQYDTMNMKLCSSGAELWSF